MPEFAALDAAAEGRVEYRKVRVPAHRYTPLRKAWPQIVTPLVEQLKLQVRFNPRSRCVELRSAPTTPDAGAVQKGADFVAAFALGFEVADALALLRLEDLFVDSFEVKDVKILREIIYREPSGASRAPTARRGTRSRTRRGRASWSRARTCTCSARRRTSGRARRRLRPDHRRAAGRVYNRAHRREACALAVVRRRLWRSSVTAFLYRIDAALAQTC